MNLVREKAWFLLIRLFKKANEDKHISFDEGRIITATDLNITELVGYCKTAWGDKNLTESEKQKMLFLLKKVEDDAVTLAEYDDIITSEEEALLTIIRDTIETFFHEHLH